MKKRETTRRTAYPLVRVRPDGDAMEAEAIARASRLLAQPLRVVSIRLTAPEWVQYRIEEEAR